MVQLFFCCKASRAISPRKIKKVGEVYISPYCRQAPVQPNCMKFGLQGQVTNVTMQVKFLVNWFRGYGVVTPQNCHFPIDLLRRPYNSVRTAVRHSDVTA